MLTKLPPDDPHLACIRDGPSSCKCGTPSDVPCMFDSERRTCTRPDCPFDPEKACTLVRDQSQLTHVSYKCECTPREESPCKYDPCTKTCSAELCNGVMVRCSPTTLANGYITRF